MKTSVFLPTLEAKYVNPALWQKIATLNLTLIRDRMTIKYGWDEERTDRAIEGYKKYLYMTQMYEESLSPTGDIDAIWHEHILHTNKYALDCKKLFGKFLHHFPTPAKWAKEKTCAGGECEGACSKDNCDAGTTNCDAGPTDCSKRTQGVKMDFDNPAMEERMVPHNYSNIIGKFFLSTDS